MFLLVLIDLVIVFGTFLLGMLMWLRLNDMTWILMSGCLGDNDIGYDMQETDFAWEVCTSGSGSLSWVDYQHILCWLNFAWNNASGRVVDLVAVLESFLCGMVMCFPLNGMNWILILGKPRWSTIQHEGIRFYFKKILCAIGSGSLSLFHYPWCVLSLLIFAWDAVFGSGSLGDAVTGNVDMFTIEWSGMNFDLQKLRWKDLICRKWI